MRVTGAIVAVLLALAGTPAPAAATLLADQPYRIGFQGRLVTDVMIDGKGPFAFVIDTASSRSLMFEHVRAALGLTQSQPQPITIYGINDVGQAMPVAPGEVSVAGETVHGLVMGVLPDEGPGGPDGILGVDVLSRYFVVLDRTAMRFKLLSSDSGAEQDYSGWTHATLTPRPLRNFPIQFWYLDTRFNDVGFHSLFDLGASVTMMNWHAAEKLGVHQRDFKSFGPPPDQLRDVLGKDAPAVKLLGLEARMSSRIWGDQLVLVANAPVFNYFDLDERPAAIVGLGLLGQNSLAIDFAGHKLYVGPTLGEDGKEKGS